MYVIVKNNRKKILNFKHNNIPLNKKGKTSLLTLISKEEKITNIKTIQDINGMEIFFGVSNLRK